jgi:hypothetical protein
VSKSVLFSLQPLSLPQNANARRKFFVNTQLYVTKTTIAFAIASLAFTIATVKETVTSSRIARFAKRMSISMVSFMLLTVGLQGPPAYALPPTDEPPERMLRCLGDAQGSISTTPQTVNLWQTATLSWNIKVPSGCGDLKLYVDNQVVSPTGSRSIQPIADTSYRLHAVLGNGSRMLATAAIKVVLPPRVAINANYLERLLVQALRTPGTYIDVENQVELDLSGREYIPIEEGVTLAGGRTARLAGPRLYTTTRPRVLFEIQGDNVRITGLRLQGADMGVPDGDDVSAGISINSNLNIEIDHNELFGWTGEAVGVSDEEGRIDYVTNPETVRVHDNYIHHNQHVGKFGYGVVVSDGAYALIERNVFDWNRHAIAGDGSDGSGYLAYRNLVLENGGYHDTYNACDLPDWVALVSPGAWAVAKALCLIPGSSPAYVLYTHQFDMHGQENCGSWHYNCGTAGEYMDIQYNSFFYAKDNAIKLRGTPEIGMYVGNNVFANHLTFDSAVQQTESGLVREPGNVLGYNGMNELGTCDFDGDGINDSFLATGQTWWYSSGGDKPWVYLNTFTKRRAEVTLGFFDGDNICDVLADGIIYPGGKTQKLPVNPLPPGGGVVSAAR